MGASPCGSPAAARSDCDGTCPRPQSVPEPTLRKPFQGILQVLPDVLGQHARTPLTGRALPLRGDRRRRAGGVLSATVGHTVVNISQPSGVAGTVCSNWADSEPSAVTTVQPSSRIRTSG